MFSQTVVLQAFSLPLALDAKKDPLEANRRVSDRPALRNLLKLKCFIHGRSISRHFWWVSRHFLEHIFECFDDFLRKNMAVSDWFLRAGI